MDTTKRVRRRGDTSRVNNGVDTTVFTPKMRERSSHLSSLSINYKQMISRLIDTFVLITRIIIQNDEERRVIVKSNPLRLFTKFWDEIMGGVTAQMHTKSTPESSVMYVSIMVHPNHLTLEKFVEIFEGCSRSRIIDSHLVNAILSRVMTIEQLTTDLNRFTSELQHLSQEEEEDADYTLSQRKMLEDSIAKTKSDIAKVERKINILRSILSTWQISQVDIKYDFGVAGVENESRVRQSSIPILNSLIKRHQHADDVLSLFTKNLQLERGECFGYDSGSHTTTPHLLSPPPQTRKRKQSISVFEKEEEARRLEKEKPSKIKNHNTHQIIPQLEMFVRGNLSRVYPTSLTMHSTLIESTHAQIAKYLQEIQRYQQLHKRPELHRENAFLKCTQIFNPTPNLLPRLRLMLYNRFNKLIESGTIFRDIHSLLNATSTPHHHRTKRNLNTLIPYGEFATWMRIEARFEFPSIVVQSEEEMIRLGEAEEEREKKKKGLDSKKKKNRSISERERCAKICQTRQLSHSHSSFSFLPAPSSSPSSSPYSRIEDLYLESLKEILNTPHIITDIAQPPTTLKVEIQATQPRRHRSKQDLKRERKEAKRLAIGKSRSMMMMMTSGEEGRGDEEEEEKTGEGERNSLPRTSTPALTRYLEKMKRYRPMLTVEYLCGGMEQMILIEYGYRKLRRRTGGEQDERRRRFGGYYRVPLPLESLPELCYFLGSLYLPLSCAEFTVIPNRPPRLNREVDDEIERRQRPLTRWKNPLHSLIKAFYPTTPLNPNNSNNSNNKENQPPPPPTSFHHVEIIFDDDGDTDTQRRRRNDIVTKFSHLKDDIHTQFGVPIGSIALIILLLPTTLRSENNNNNNTTLDGGMQLHLPHQDRSSTIVMKCHLQRMTPIIATGQQVQYWEIHIRSMQVIH